MLAVTIIAAATCLHFTLTPPTTAKEHIFKASWTRKRFKLNFSILRACKYASLGQLLLYQTASFSLAPSLTLDIFSYFFLYAPQIP